MKGIPTINKGVLILSGMLFLLLFSRNQDARAQDPRFSQYYAAPTYFNPALTGAYEGTYRLMAVYRDQWRGAADNPFVSYSAAGDVRFEITESNINKDAAAGGLVFLRDQVDIIDFSTTFAAITGAFHKSLNDKKRTNLSFGFRFGMSQKNVNYERVSFQDQFNGVDQYDLPTNEVLPRNNFTYPDLALGLNFSTKPSPDSRFSTGFSVDHVIPVDISFYQEGNSNNPTVEFPENRIFQRYSADASYLFPLGPFSSDFLTIRSAYMTQGSFQEAILGLSWKTKVGKKSGNNFIAGGFLRANNFLDQFSPSTVVLMTGVELQSVIMAISYDMNLKTTSFARRNAIELSVIYIGDYISDSYLCPTF